ncbi:MAG: hypothetical protein JWN04_4889 [Myxococcaceae bacterium]|nr:hypothetical protein [Myxococcaceae bacterium]
MNNLVNLTPFSAIALPSLDKADEELLVIIVSARFSFTLGKKDSQAAVTVHDEQPAVQMSDEYWGDPTTSSLRYEGQTAYEKPGTDIQLAGHAWRPPGERQVTESWLGVQVGANRMAALVFGDRRWVKGVLLTSSRPLPFERIPIRYEHCFGGSAAPGSSARIIQASERNPVGCGLVLSSKTVDGQPLPNFELPSARIQDPTDYPLPAGFGPVARHWQPRRGLAGTYDEAWVRKRAPYWPNDFDLRFFSSAPPALCAVPHLVGGERVSIVGAHPDGNVQFVLPQLRLSAKINLRHESVRKPMILDGLLLEPDEGHFTMTFRASHKMGKGMADLESMVVRSLESWEEST